ncbi:ferritin [Alkalicoccobacillus murimartini]|uniref:Ferritin n=1 Tax=Alkalicoccobacillus murimartini TaxID=171685 RepID=A0ABT9YL22_9BACI|nr:ferritin [Alkalicoccobacillus murimartini]MDQ0208553.1 ferritin [Alkalicoccobacillus murimartini]
MLPDDLTKALNKQVNFEFYAAHSYTAIAAYFANQGFKGFRNFFLVQAEEERFHAMKIYNYLVDVGERVIIETMDQPKNLFQSPLEAIEHSLAQEKDVTKAIYKIADLALDHKEHATIALMNWFVEEQVEEESMFRDMIAKVKRIDVDSSAFVMLDSELGKRSFDAEEED